MLRWMRHDAGDQASARAGTRRRPETSPYRCFLSDLTGFGELRRAGPTRTLDVRIALPRAACQPMRASNVIDHSR